MNNLFSSRANLPSSQFVPKPKKKKGKSKSKSSGDSSTPPRTPIKYPSSMGYLASKIPSHSSYKPNLPTPEPVEILSVPVFEGTPIPTGTRSTFSKSISFKSSSNQFMSYRTTKSHLAELTKLLLSYPEMKVFIVGNIGSTDPRILKGNSDEALNQPYFFLNGTKTTARNLMNSRAKGVYDLLLKQGVSKEQLDFGPGSIYGNARTGRRVSFDLRNTGR